MSLLLYMVLSFIQSSLWIILESSLIVTILWDPANFNPHVFYLGVSYYNVSHYFFCFQCFWWVHFRGFPIRNPILKQETEQTYIFVSVKDSNSNQFNREKENGEGTVYYVYSTENRVSEK